MWWKGDRRESAGAVPFSWNTLAWVTSCEQAIQGNYEIPRVYRGLLACTLRSITCHGRRGEGGLRVHSTSAKVYLANT